MLIPILIAIIAGAAVFLAIFGLRSVASKKSDKPLDEKSKKKNNAQIVRNCSKKLARNPRDVPALKALGEVYYKERNWEKAYPLYNTMLELLPSHIDLDPAVVPARQGICAFKLGKMDEAMKGFVTAYKTRPNDYDLNYYFGQLLYQKNEFAKAFACLKKAKMINPEAAGISKALGLSLYKTQHFRESLPVLRKALDESPGDKEIIFSMANAMEESGMGDKALKLFMHLRPDPQYGASACVSAGMIHERMKQHQTALQDYEIGIKLESPDPKILTTLYYRAANCCIVLENFGAALDYLKKTQAVTPNYKDTNALIQRYQELNSNSNLQTYMMANTGSFVALCKKFVEAYYPKSIVHFHDVSVVTDCVEVLCTVDTGQWEDTEIFRFYRNPSPIGELFARDFHAKIQESQADRGFCVTVGSFTDGARKYVEGRPIDLIEKTQLMSTLKKIGAQKTSAPRKA